MLGQSSLLSCPQVQTHVQDDQTPKHHRGPIAPRDLTQVSNLRVHKLGAELKMNFSVTITLSSAAVRGQGQFVFKNEALQRRQGIEPIIGHLKAYGNRPLEPRALEVEFFPMEEVLHEKVKIHR